MHLIGNAGALVALRRIHHRVVTRLSGLAVEHRGVAAPGCDAVAVTELEHIGDVAAPGQRVVGDQPDVGHFAHRREDRRRIDHAGGMQRSRRRLREHRGLPCGLLRLGEDVGHGRRRRLGTAYRKNIRTREHVALRLRRSGADRSWRRSLITGEPFGKAALCQGVTTRRPRNGNCGHAKRTTLKKRQNLSIDLAAASGTPLAMSPDRDTLCPAVRQRLCDAGRELFTIREPGAGAHRA